MAVHPSLFVAADLAAMAFITSAFAAS